MDVDEALEMEQLVGDGLAPTPPDPEPKPEGATGWWRNLPEKGQEVADTMFDLGTYVPPDGPLVRAASLKGSKNIVMDPLAVDRYPRAWELAWGQRALPDYHIWRVEQALANRPKFGTRLKRGSLRGRPGYLVGNGPSAKLAAEFIPDISERRGFVLTLNGAAGVMPGQYDAWGCACALWPNENQAWLDALLAEWLCFDHGDAHGMFSTYAHHQLVEQFPEDRCNFYTGCHRNDYRHLVRPEDLEEMPCCIEGIQGAVSYLHWLAWLGCNPIVLFGVDQAREPKEHYHAATSTGWRPDGTPPEDQWVRVADTTDGRTLETCGPLILAARHLAAMAMWMLDGGVPVFNASTGLDLVFAPHIEAEEIVRALEGSS